MVYIKYISRTLREVQIVSARPAVTRDVCAFDLSMEERALSPERHRMDGRVDAHTDCIYLAGEWTPSFEPILPPSLLMPPQFLTTLAPRKERSENGRPILRVLEGLTWIQWGHFLAG